jgi:hypothetical protein
MSQELSERKARLDAMLAEYSSGSDIALLRSRLQEFVSATPAAALRDLIEPYRDDPEVAAPVYEKLVEADPRNAQAMVVLANAYWLQGRGPAVVGELANRAITVDPGNRGAWHLWALSEGDPRQRTGRWEQVSQRFPEDTLALAAVADNAAAVAGAERDYEMLDLAITTFERLRERSTETAQRQAVDVALRALREWRF